MVSVGGRYNYADADISKDLLGERQIHLLDTRDMRWLSVFVKALRVEDEHISTPRYRCPMVTIYGCNRCVSCVCKIVMDLS